MQRVEEHQGPFEVVGMDNMIVTVSFFLDGQLSVEAEELKELYTGC